MKPLIDNIHLYFIASLLIAIASFVYSYVLVQDGEVFSSLYRRLYKLFNTESRYVLGLPPHPLFKVLIHCEKCVSGQLSLWLFFIYGVKYYLEKDFVLIVAHLLFVTLTIFTTLLIKQLYTKHIEK